jgi:hypothetical protein
LAHKKPPETQRLLLQHFQKAQFLGPRLRVGGRYHLDGLLLGFGHAFFRQACHGTLSFLHLQIR